MSTAKKLDQLKSDFKRCGVIPKIETLKFKDFKKLPRISGIYSIWQGDICIYVGQGGGKQGIRGRFDPHHYNKAYGTCITVEGRKISGDPDGWQSGRVEPWWDPALWTIEYFECGSSVNRTYLEGAMMLELKPLCNDENYEDSQRQI